MKIIGLFVFFVFVISFGFAQKMDSTGTHFFSGSASFTNNGISLVPSFSLEKPAIMFLTSLGGKRFSVDPDIRFSWNGKPWSFVFNSRYKLINKSKFKMKVGANLGFNFKETVLLQNATPMELTLTRRYAGVEFAPNYFITKNKSIGAYYLYAHGLNDGAIKNNHFITLNANFSHLAINKKYFLKFAPQLYYLKQNKNDGFYASTTIGIAKNNYPISFSSILNKTISTNIVGSKSFIWNLSIVYSFNKTYTFKKLGQ